MYKVVGKEDDMFKVLDMDTGEDELLSAKELVLALGVAEIDGCKHSRNGIEVWYDGVEPYEIAIEVWKPVSLYNCKTQDGVWKYWVSNFGQVAVASYVDRVGRTHDARILLGSISKFGYRNVILRVDGGEKSLRVCRLVATEFVFNKHGCPIVNHKNEVKDEDWCGNLEWCTYSYNNTYNNIQFRRVESLKKCVRQYSLSGKFIKEFESLRDAREFLGVLSSTCIGKCCRRDKNYNHVHGFVWRFVNDDELYDLPEVARKYLISCMCKFVRQYSLNGEFICEYVSAVLASCCTGANRSSILSVCKRRETFTSAGGFIWRHAYDDEFADKPENIKAIAERGVRQNVEP